MSLTHCYKTAVSLHLFINSLEFRSPTFPESGAISFKKSIMKVVRTKSLIRWLYLSRLAILESTMRGLSGCLHILSESNEACFSKLKSSSYQDLKKIWPFEMYRSAAAVMVFKGSKCGCKPKLISSTYLNPRLKYNYFYFWKTNVSHVEILLPVLISTMSP